MGNPEICCREYLFESLVHLLHNDCIDRIPVNAIVEKAGVSRSTFYRYCYDKYELLNLYYSSVLDRTLYRYHEGMSWKQSSRLIYREIHDKLPMYQNALKSADMNCLKNYILKISRELHFRVLQNNAVDVEDWRVHRTMDAHIYGNLEVMCMWILEGMVEPIDDMIDLLDSRMPHQFAPFFLGESAAS